MNHSINVVLVRPIYSSNVGSVARAMANQGAHRLILVGPQCEVDFQAHQQAAGAQKSLNSHIVYPGWQEFYAHEGQGLRLGFTRRGGRNRPAEPFEDVLLSVWKDKPSTLKNSIYLVFGPEDHGLARQDLDFLNACCELPLFGEFKSMNLSHAVSLALFIIQNFIHQRGEKADLARDREGAVFTKQALFFPDQTIKDWLVAMGFNLEARKASAYITLKRVLLRNFPSENDLMVLEAILQQNIRKLKGEDKNPTSKIIANHSDVLSKSI